MRLIDADANREDFIEGVYDILSDEPDNVKANLIIDTFDEMPTAYDPDKVEEQLNDRFRVVRTDEDLGWNKAIDEAITIVKGGGVDD